MSVNDLKGFIAKDFCGTLGTSKKWATMSNTFKKIAMQDILGIFLLGSINRLYLNRSKPQG